MEPSQENGAKEENGDEVFPAKSKAPGSPPLRRTSSRAGKLEKNRAGGEAQEPEKSVGDSEEGAGQHPARASSSEVEDGCGSPTEERPAGEQTEEPAEVKERVAGEEEAPGQSSQDTKGLEEGAVEEETPQPPPGGGAGGHSPEQGTSEEKQDEGTSLKPGCSPDSGHAQPDTSGEVPRTEVGALPCPSHPSPNPQDSAGPARPFPMPCPLYLSPVSQLCRKTGAGWRPAVVMGSSQKGKSVYCSASHCPAALASF